MYGFRVVKGYGAMSGLEVEMAARMDDFPELGNPTSATSASSFSSITAYRALPGKPFVALIGLTHTLDLKAALPFPPRPPSRTMKLSFKRFRSQICVLVSASRTTVPSGTSRMRLLPDLPYSDLSRPL